MKKLFLCSSFNDTVDLLKNFMKEEVKGKTVTFIPTASVTEEVTFYVDEAKKAFETIGIIVDELNINTAAKEEISKKIKQNDYIYFSGGNTFFLLQELKRTATDQLIIEAVNSGKLFIGESAGSMIASPCIEYVKDMDDAEVASGLDTYSALGLIDFYPVPHYGEFPFIEAADMIISKYNSTLKLCPISNSQAILVDGDDVRIASKIE